MRSRSARAPSSDRSSDDRVGTSSSISPLSGIEPLLARLKANPDVIDGAVAGPGFLNLKIADVPIEADANVSVVDGDFEAPLIAAATDDKALLQRWRQEGLDWHWSRADYHRLLKTTGGKGLHVVTPIRADGRSRVEWDQAKEVAFPS